VPTPTIVLLHGQPDTSASLLQLRRALNRLLPEARVYAPDRPGYGANPLPATDFAGNARWLLDQLPATSGPVVLLGHSWAGGIAALAAAQASDRIDGVVLLASIGPSCLLPIDLVLAAPVAGTALSWLVLQLGKPLVGRRAGRMILRSQAAADLPYARLGGLAMRNRPVWRSFLVEQRALIGQLPALDQVWERIPQPTLVISGDRDPLIPAATPDELARRIPDVRAHRIRGGHDLQLRQPEVVADLVAGFAAPLLELARVGAR